MANVRVCDLCGKDITHDNITYDIEICSLSFATGSGVVETDSMEDMCFACKNLVEKAIEELRIARNVKPGR